MSRLTDWIDRFFYSDYRSNWDDNLFRTKILQWTSSDMTILDLGAGAGIIEAMNFRGKVRRVCGVDLDPRVMENRHLDEARVADVSSLPFDDATFDLVFSDNVLEHLTEPLHVFREVARVLKPGGMFLFKTPNKRHYMPLVARFTSHTFHLLVNRYRGREIVDTFPTLYLANTASCLASLAESAGFTVHSMKCIEGRPEYLRMTAITYLFGLVYERIVNLSERLAPFRILLIGAMQKKA